MASGNPSFDFLNEDSKTAHSEQKLVAQCPHCQGKMKAPAKLAGRKVRCPKCQQGFTLPAAASSTQTSSTPAGPPPRQKTPPLAADLEGLLNSVTVLVSGSHEGRMLLKAETQLQRTADGLIFRARTLPMKRAAAIVIGAIVLMLLSVGLVIGILNVMGMYEKGAMMLLFALFSLIFLIFLAGLFSGWFQFLGQATQIELRPEMPLEVQLGPKMKKAYHLILKSGRDKLYFLALAQHKRELRDFLARTINKTAPL